jgi:soluble lytic murein transglycosylase-like protein
MEINCATSSPYSPSRQRIISTFSKVFLMAVWIRASILAFSVLTAPFAAHAEGETINLRESLSPPPVEVEAPAAAVAPIAPETTGPRRGRRSDALQADMAAAAGVRALIAQQAAVHGVPAPLADAVARIESRYNPRAASRGNFGLMQIRLQTARGLLDAETNAHFGVKHLARAYRMANGDVCGAIMRYQSGLRATRMSGANRVYCAKAKAIMGSGRVAAAS